MFEPWYYAAARFVAIVAIIGSVLSVIGGIVVGIAVSKYTGRDQFGLPATQHHAGVVAYWIAGGVFAAAFWLGLAVALELLADVGLSLRRAAWETEVREHQEQLRRDEEIEAEG